MKQIVPDASVDWAMPTSRTMCIDRSSESAGYRWCRKLARTHYENFPVASFLLPRKLRNPVAVIYAFARNADDIADEGHLSDTQRLALLADIQSALDRIANHQSLDTPLYRALADTVRRHCLPLQPFYDLLSAFRQDVTQSRYASFGELMDYCRRSANPVGRLLLHLSGNASERNLALSDAVCSALQLINFLQDIGQDYDKNRRIYLPADDMARFQVNEAQISRRKVSPGLNALIQYQAQRADRLLRAGHPLGTRLRGRFGLELRAIILGGSRVLEMICQRDNPYNRPRLYLTDRVGIAWTAIRQGFH
jgi:squalene synthase HpnC